MYFSERGMKPPGGLRRGGGNEQSQNVGLLESTLSSVLAIMGEESDRSRQAASDEKPASVGIAMR